jgi:P2 family phage contractile tail tube protein
MIQLPRVIRKYNIYFEDDGWAGICSEVELPDLQIKSEDFRGGGMDMAIPIDMGMEIPELGFTMEEHSASILGKFGKADVIGRFAAAQSNGNGSAVAYRVEFTGAFQQATLGTVSPGDKSPMKGTIKCRKLVITQGGAEIAYIDVLEVIRRIGGTDYLQTLKQMIS